MQPLEIVQFLAELSVNNEKAWFDTHRERYKRLRLEFVGFVRDVLERLTPLDPALDGVSAEQALFRINRDTRFSHNKNPYKTQFSASLSPEGRAGAGPVYYLHLDFQGELFTAGGHYAPEKGQFERIRRFVLAHPAALERLLSEVGPLEGERLKKLPRGFAEDSPHPDFLRLKQFLRSGAVNLFDAPNLDPLERVLGEFSRYAPLVEWLRRAGA